MKGLKGLVLGLCLVSVSAWAFQKMKPYRLHINNKSGRSLACTVQPGSGSLAIAQGEQSYSLQERGYHCPDGWHVVGFFIKNDSVTLSSACPCTWSDNVLTINKL